MFSVIRLQRHLSPFQCLCKYSKNANAVVPSSEPTKSPLEPKDQKKTDLAPDGQPIWRTPWHKQKGQKMTMLRSFYREENNIEFMNLLQTPIDLRPSAIKKWWLKHKEEQAKYLQQYIPKRHEILGNELAAAHFLVYRGGAVKFHEDDKWIKAVDGKYQLPDRYKENMYLQGIDCTDMDLYYEGLDNLRGLHNVEWLSFNGCKHIDDFCIDVISNVFSHSLLYLDLRNCFKITERGLGALYKMRNLKILYLDDFLKDTKYELTCLLLQELSPDLDIKSDVVTFEIK